MRTHDALFFFRTQQLLAGDWTTSEEMSLTHVGEAQGEGVALGPNNEVAVIGEGGDESAPGVFARLRCAG